MGEKRLPVLFVLGMMMIPFDQEDHVSEGKESRRAGVHFRRGT
jgi:hypothetical protein